jgi:phosphotriesterase-related protein
VADLVNRGYVKQVLLSQDVYLKMNLKRYGGWGYAHLLVNVVPMLRRAGVTDENLRMMLVENPARVLARA